MQRIWKDVPGFEGFYMVSNDGQVRSFHRGDTLIKPYRVARRSAGLELTKQHGKVQRTLHSMVCEAFIGPRPRGHDINPMDGIKTHNGVTNLEDTTRLNNRLHAINGRRALNGSSGSTGYLCLTCETCDVGALDIDHLVRVVGGGFVGLVIGLRDRLHRTRAQPELRTPLMATSTTARRRGVSANLLHGFGRVMALGHFW
jgi:hypothetical protein